MKNLYYNTKGKNEVFNMLPFLNDDTTPSNYLYLIEFNFSFVSSFPLCLYQNEHSIVEIDAEEIFQMLNKKISDEVRQSIIQSCLDAIACKEDTIDVFVIIPLFNTVGIEYYDDIFIRPVSRSVDYLLKLFGGSYE